MFKIKYNCMFLRNKFIYMKFLQFYSFILQSTSAITTWNTSYEWVQLPYLHTLNLHYLFSLVNIVTRHWVGWMTSHGSISSRVKRFSLFQSIQTSSGAHTASYSIVPDTLSPWVMWIGPWSCDHSAPPIAEVTGITLPLLQRISCEHYYEPKICISNTSDPTPIYVHIVYFIL